MTSKIKIRILLSMVSMPLLCSAQDAQLPKQQSWYERAKNYIAPSSIKGAQGSAQASAAVAATIALSAASQIAKKDYPMLLPTSLTVASATAPLFFGLSNYWKGGKEYLSSYYLPAYLLNAAALYGITAQPNYPISMLALLGMAGAAPALVWAHKQELKKKTQESQALMDKINSMLLKNITEDDVKNMMTELNSLPHMEGFKAMVRGVLLSLKQIEEELAKKAERIVNESDEQERRKAALKAMKEILKVWASENNIKLDDASIEIQKAD